MTPRPVRRAAIARVAVASLLGLTSVLFAVPPARAYPTAGWVQEENARPGTSAWRIPRAAPHDIQGYANRVSVQAGERVRLFVDTSAATFHLVAYRLGYYQGLGGRRIWTSAETAGMAQPPPAIIGDTNTVEARWARSLRFQVRPRFVQGSYLLKLVASTGGQSYVPLIVRDDASTAALVLQHQVTTWQAYNGWGGYSLYGGPDGTFATRARAVSFDRPYDGVGAAGMLRALRFIALVERDGMDVTYWTDIDLHERPELLLAHRSLVLLNHDEYWSTRMRRGAETARAAGVNLANLGANAVYRHIRLESSPLGPDRRVVCYKIRAEDPLNGVDNSEVTVDWRDPPVSDPESALLGAMYQCYGVEADAVVVDPDSWILAGTGLARGDTIPKGVMGEYDRVFAAAPTPGNIQILAHSPVWCHGKPQHADMTYYTASSGAGVFDVASTDWYRVLECGPPTLSAACSPAAVTITLNVLQAFSVGPAGLAHPSVPNAAAVGYELQHPITP